MMPDVPLREVMQRTMDNYRFVDQGLSCGAQVFEVTQMINSFLGAFAHPWETWKRELGSISIEEAQERGWPRVAADDERDREPLTLGDLLRLMRNAFAHGNILYVSDFHGDIGALQIWNEDNGWRTWGTTLDVPTLRKFLECFEAEALTLPDRPMRQPPNRHVSDRPEPTHCGRCKQPLPTRRSN